MSTLTVRITRYDPERNDEPRWESHRVEADPSDRVLDVLMRGTEFAITSQTGEA